MAARSLARFHGARRGRSLGRGTARVASAAALVGGALALAVAALGAVDAMVVASLAAPPTASALVTEDADSSVVELARIPFALARPALALLLLGGAVGLLLAWRGARSEATTWGFGGVFVGLGMLTLGSAGIEWIGREALTPTVFGLAFLFEVAGLLGVVVGAAALGVLSWRSAALPRFASVALACAPFGFLLTVMVPGSAWLGILWLGVVWLAVGAALGFGSLPAPRAGREPAHVFAEG